MKTRRTIEDKFKTASHVLLAHRHESTILFFTAENKLYPDMSEPRLQYGDASSVFPLPNWDDLLPLSAIEKLG